MPFLLIAAEIDSYRERLKGDSASFELEYFSTEITERKFIARFSDLSPSTALIVGENLSNDICDGFRNNESPSDWRRTFQLCLLLDSFVKSSVCVKYLNVTAKLVRHIFRFLNEFRKTFSSNFTGAGSKCYSLVLLDFTLLHAWCRGYFSLKVNFEEKELKKLYRFKPGSLASEAHFFSLARLLYERLTNSSEDDVDEFRPEKTEHSCHYAELCFVEKFCLRKFYHSNIVLCRKFLASADASCYDTFLFATINETQSPKLMREIFLYENENLTKSLLGKLFIEIAENFEDSFPFGGDMSVWLRKFGEIFQKPIEKCDLATASEKIVGKFFVRVQRERFAEKFNDESFSEKSTKLTKMFETLRFLPMECFADEFRFILLRFVCVLFELTSACVGFCEIFCQVFDKFSENEFAKLDYAITTRIFSRVVDGVESLEEFPFRLFSQLRVLNYGISKIDDITGEDTSFVSSKAATSFLRIYFDSSTGLDNDALAENLLRKTLEFRNYSRDLDVLVSALRYERKFSRNSSTVADVLRKTLRKCARAFSGDVSAVEIFFEFCTLLRGIEPHCSSFDKLSIDFAVSLSRSEIFSEILRIVCSSGEKFRIVSEAFWFALSKYTAVEFGECFALAESNSEVSYFLLACVLSALSNKDLNLEPIKEGFSKELITLIGSAVESLPLSVALRGNNARFTEVWLKFARTLVDFPFKSFDAFKKFGTRRLSTNVLTSLCSIDLTSPEFADTFCRSFLSAVDVASAVFKKEGGHPPVGSVCGLLSTLRSALRPRLASTGQPGVPDDGGLFRCARAFSRLIGSVSASDDFAKSAPYLLADFFGSSGKFDVADARCRAVLSIAAYDALDLCRDEKTATFLAANLDDGAKNVFRLMFEDYKKFFKYNGYV